MPDLKNERKIVMTLKKRIAASVTAVMLAVGALPAVPTGAAVNLENLPVPIAEDKDSKEAEAFAKTIPELKAETSDWGNVTLSWKPVKGALYYKVYQKPKDGGFVCIDNVFDTEYSFYNEYKYECSTEYRVRAVTFTYADEKITTKISNTVEIKALKPKNYEYDSPADDASYAGADSGADAGVAGDDDIFEEPEYEEADFISAEIEPSYAPMPEPSGYAEENTEEYGHFEESGVRSAALSPLSTFSADVDTASYANLRRLINGGCNISGDEVRIEEMLNYFDYDYKKPGKNSRFAINTELSDCPWNSKAQLLSIGIQGAELAEEPASNLVFLIDTSGSMDSEDKLELVKKSIKLLSKTMSENDRISIVTYSGSERIILAGANGNQVKTVSALTSILDANGSTNGEGGINAAYALAEKYYIKGGNNRIIMCTDGDLNVGISDENELKKLIEEKRKGGVYFSVMGFGTGNIKDNKMETLADNGNGSYHYIDSVNEARKIFVEERSSTLYTIAKDVKIQLEFNPNAVESYRLIGYDNRRLANEDFTNDKKDAGEVGAGHSVTALYEIIPAKGAAESGLKYQQTSEAADSGEMLTIKVRYKKPEDGKTYQTSKTVMSSDYSKNMSDNMKLACAVTEFGLVLKDSDYKGSANLKEALKYVQSLKEPDVYEKELAELIKKYSSDK